MIKEKRVLVLTQVSTLYVISLSPSHLTKEKNVKTLLISRNVLGYLDWFNHRQVHIFSIDHPQVNTVRRITVKKQKYRCVALTSTTSTIINLLVIHSKQWFISAKHVQEQLANGFYKLM